MARVIGKKASTRGSALVLTLFTVVALLTLGTTFIAISIGESRQSRGDKDSTLARNVAMYGVNWATSYMSMPAAWVDHDDTHPARRDGSDRLWLLKPTDASSDPKVVSWMNRTLRWSQEDGASNTIKWFLRMHTQGTSAVVDLSSQGLQGVFDLEIEKLSSDKTGQEHLSTQLPNYSIKSTGYVFKAGEIPYTVEGSTLRLNVNAALAARAVTVRIHEEAPWDSTLHESNMRSWNIPGFNTQFGINSAVDNGTGEINPANFPPGSQEAQQAQLQQQLLQQMFNEVQLDSVGIPTNYQASGNFRVDGVDQTDPDYNAQFDPFARVAGSIHVFATNQAEADTIKFNGSVSWSNPDADASHVGNTYDGGYNKDNMFTKTPQTNRTKGLPAVADYMTGYIADTTNRVAGKAPVERTTGWVEQFANPSTLPSGSVAGYVKVATPASGVTDDNVVGSGWVRGKDIEMLPPGSNPVQQPGFARTEIKFENGKVYVTKTGAYSGLRVDDGTGIFDAAGVDPAKIANGVIYVDGGNVEVKGTVPASLTIVAGASSDRPTVATRGVRENGSLVAKPGLPVLITPDQHASIPTSIYRDGADVGFAADGNGRLTKIPAKVGDKYFWPAYDPTKVGKQAGDDTAVTSEAPVVREGNVSIVGDVTKGSGGNLGIVAQNYILLSDQTAGRSGSGQELKVESVLMSMSRSVQYGGFMSGGVNDYYKSMAVSPDSSSGTIRGSIPRPRYQVNNGKFKLKGSIIGAFADVESTKNGVGYALQDIGHDASLKNAAPPMMPNFSRNKIKSAIRYVVVAISDSAVTRSGTK